MSTQTQNKRRWTIDSVLLFSLTLVTFAMSAVALNDLALRASIPAFIAWGWPVMIDGTIVMTIRSIVKRRGRPSRALRFSKGVFLFCTAVSVDCNGVHT
jgi:hypothetical protein